MAARTELRVMVLAATHLVSDGGMGAMSVYCVLWIDHALKLSTRVHVGGGRFPVWGDQMAFRLGDDALLLSHSAITVKVLSEGLTACASSWRSTLLGTAHLPLAEIARLKAMRENPEDPDIVQLQLTTPARHVRGSISLAISLVQDSSQRWGSSSSAPLLTHQSGLVTGYPVGLLHPTPYEVHQQGSSGPDMDANVRSSGHWGFPVMGRSQSELGAGPYFPSEGSSAYRLTPLQPYCPCMDHETTPVWQRRKHIALAVIGGAIAGFVIADILGVFFR